MMISMLKSRQSNIIDTAKYSDFDFCRILPVSVGKKKPFCNFLGAVLYVGEAFEFSQ